MHHVGSYTLRFMFVMLPCVQGAAWFELELVQQASQGVCSEGDTRDAQQDHYDVEEDHTASRGPGDVHHVYQYHILYQPSYQVPTMAMRGSASGDACWVTSLASNSIA